MNRPKQKSYTRKKLVSTANNYKELYTQAVYSIMEIRHALGDTDAKWSHPEVIEKIKKLMELEPKEEPKKEESESS